ncbi:MAG: Flp pilus assembly complex ATPase component TadA [Nanoarchaeota archaeon]|nr:Flp pilus assembly complex ATPase component TadA [Nanoarchaeota archaeon]
MKLFKKKEVKGEPAEEASHETPHRHIQEMARTPHTVHAAKPEPGPAKSRFHLLPIKKAELPIEHHPTAPQGGAKPKKRFHLPSLKKKAEPVVHLAVSKTDAKPEEKKKLIPSFKKHGAETGPAKPFHTMLSKKRDEPVPKKHRLPTEIIGLKKYEITLELDIYKFSSQDVPITVRIFRAKGEYVPIYEVSIASISSTTELILEKIRMEIVRQVTLGMIDITAPKKSENIEDKFKDAIEMLVSRYFPDIDDQSKGFLVTYLVQRSLGMGKVEILMDDPNLEEVAINSADEPVWVYHRKHGWLKTNIPIKDEEQTKQFATMIGRRVGRQITVLTPLLDAHLAQGDRVNATLIPISARGNTLTIRKFSRDPWTITKFIKTKTLDTSTAALMWLGIQYELSMLICGGTASGKTSMLNVCTNFFPPNQRIISIEDTREIQLPSFLHWIPMSTREPNPEGKGEVSMLDLLVNSLRQRPDRIVVGEVRRKREAEVLFEAIHTGHSVYATFHANNAHEAITRLTNAPIEVPKVMLPAISMMVVQFRNRRTGLRRTFQVAEITEDGNQRTLFQFDPKKDIMIKANRSKELMDTLMLYTGYTPQEISKILAIKEMVLKYLPKQNLNTVDEVGHAMAQYYTNQESFLKLVRANKPMR